MVSRTGPSSEIPPHGVEMISVDSAEAMHQAVMQVLMPGTIFIGAAAVCDYAPHKIAHQKLKKQDDTGYALKLQQTPDILAAVAKSKRARYVMGFAAETHDLIAYAKQKLLKKQLDCIVANIVSACTA